jgi:cellulose synthase/poly-beta-1,6-N-acetylglucosamine synthase-like glycosyltransferase
MAVLVEAFDLVEVPLAVRGTLPTAEIRATYVSRRHHNLVVVDKANGGRSDALNAALRTARHPYVCVIDADSLLEEDALLKVAKPILDAPELLVATGGTIRVANGCRVDHGRVVEVRLPRSMLAKFQVLEYLRAFLDARAGWSRLNALGIISGAFGLFHRPLVELVGGYRTDTVGEDFELTIRLHRHLRDRDEPYRIMFVTDPVCWTEVPEEVGTLAKQRRRWQRGLWECVRSHQRMVFNPRYRAVGMLAMPYFVLFEFLSPLFALGGLVVTLGLFLLGALSAAYVASFLVVSLGLGVMLSLAALLIEEIGYHRYERRSEIRQLLLCAVLEGVGYHQLHNVWRLMGCVDLARGTSGWGAQQRHGFEQPSEPAEATEAGLSPGSRAGAPPP